MLDVLSTAISKKYTDDSVEGAGAIKGKNCQIQSITDIEGGHRVTFAWYDEEEVIHTGYMDVMNGEKGDKGDKGDKGQQGEQGEKGADGADGVSPEVTITDIAGGHRVTITDADHPLGQSFDVLDGDGTVVVANPEGSATADLTKVQIGSVIYGLAGSISCTYSNENLTIV